MTVNEAEATLQAVRDIAFDPDTFSALEHGVIVSFPNNVRLSDGEVRGYAVDALRDIRAALGGVA